MYSPRKTSHTSSVAFIVISFFTDGPISVMVLCQPLSHYHTFVFQRHLAVYRLSFSPWRHLSFPCPHRFFFFKSDLKTATYMTTMRWEDLMGGSLPTVEMIRVKLVWARMANGMLAPHPCQSKNSEVLNTFHPERGGGARSAIRKSAEGKSVCQYLRLLVLPVEVSRDAVVK